MLINRKHLFLVHLYFYSCFIIACICLVHQSKKHPCYKNFQICLKTANHISIWRVICTFLCALMVKWVYDECISIWKKSKGGFKEAALSVFSWRNPWQQMILYLCVIYTWFILGVLVLCDLHKNKLLKMRNNKKYSKAPPWFNSIFLWNIQ